MAAPITYETLFDILRKESSREDLQMLEQSFYADVASFMKEKLAETTSSGSAGHKAAIECSNIQKIMKELYERRERKLLLLALNKARTESAIIDPSILLPEEKALFDTLVTRLKSTKRSILDGIGSVPSTFSARLTSPAAAIPVSPPPTGATPPAVPAFVSGASPPDEPSSAASTSSSSLANSTTPPSSSAASPSSSSTLVTPAAPGMLSVKFLKETPKFLGKDMKVLGPFSVGQQAQVPREIAEVLLKKGRAQHC